MGSGSNSSGGGGAPGTMSPEMKKMVQSIKEIVSNFSESEICAMLVECNNDPDAAVQRLLSQDTFHEVKSKRERRKESKETQDTRSRGNSTGSNHGVKGANERNLGRSAAFHTSPNEYSTAAYKRENESVSSTLHSSSSSAHHAAAKHLNQQSSPQGDFFSADDGRLTARKIDSTSSYVQLHSGLQSSWSGATTGVSMADIVKMGRPQNNDGLKSTEIPQDIAASYPSDYYFKADSHFPNQSYVPKRINELSNNTDQHASYAEWPVIDQSTATTGSSVLDVSTVPDAENYSNQSNLYSGGGNFSRNYKLDNVQVSMEGVAREDFNLTRSASASSRQNFMDSAGAASHYDNGMSKDMSSYNATRRTHECHEDVPFRTHSAAGAGDDVNTVTSAAAELERLSLRKEDHVKSPRGDNFTVVFPHHLRALAADCSHLSFGSFKSSNGTASSGPPELNSHETTTEEVSAAMDSPSARSLDARYLGYRADGPMGSFNSTYKATADAGNHDFSVSTRPEVMKDRKSEATYDHEYISSLSVPDSSSENIPQSSTLPFAMTDRTVRNRPPFPNEAIGYSNSRPTDLLTSTVASLSDYEHHQGASRASQSLSSRFGGAVSGTFLPQPSSQTVPDTVGLGFQQHLTPRSYPQSSHTVDQLANMIGYPSALPQSRVYPYMPSAVPESYPSDSSFQSLADMKYGLQQFESGGSASNYPVANANASGYAGFRNSTNIPGSFLHNPSVAPTATNDDSYDLFLSQYADANHLNPPFRQNDSSVWDYAAGSRTKPSVPSRAYYTLQAQNQQHVGYRHNQQSSQHYGAPGYPDFYQSQTGIPQEYQRQSLDDLTLDSQFLSSEQIQRLLQQRRY